MWNYCVVIQLIMVLFSDYLPESRTQQVVAPKPAPQNKKEKSTGKKDPTCPYLKAREKRLASYDRTGTWYYCPSLLRRLDTFSNYVVVLCAYVAQ